MSKYLYFAAAIALLVLLLAAKSLYSDNQQLKEDKTKLEQSLADAQSKNASLNETISKQAETQQSIDDTQQAIKAMHDDIANELQKTKYSIKNQIKGLPCYDQTIPADAIDAICIMQPSNKACHHDNDKSKSGNSSSVDASKAKAN
jgi:phosphoglycerate-specific signal transduction histidine kinase